MSCKFPIVVLTPFAWSKTGDACLLLAQSDGVGLAGRGHASVSGREETEEINRLRSKMANPIPVGIKRARAEELLSAVRRPGYFRAVVFAALDLSGFRPYLRHSFA